MPYSGKSTVAKMLLEKLSWERIYVGGIRRELARKKGMTIEELNIYGETHPETDVDVDKEAAAQARKLNSKGKNVIVEGRTQFHFLPESLKIYIKVNDKEAVKRMLKDMHDAQALKARNEKLITSEKEALKRIHEREEEDARRYNKFYGIDHRDEKQYDFIVDSSKLTPEEVVEEIIQFINKNKKETTKINSKKKVK